MAERPVTGADGRVWTLRSELEWRTPATADDFEHDVAGGYVPAAIMIVMTVIFGLTLLLWMPDSVAMPGWLVLLLVLFILFFPLRWIFRRPWKVVAETEGDHKGQPAERWVGTVRGMIEVRAELNRIKQSIERESLPDFEGPLRPVE